MNISLDKVSAGYDKNNFILKDISVSFTGGGIWGILGPNGSGKTTLLRVLAGILPYKGHIQLEMGCDDINHSSTVTSNNPVELSSMSKRNLARYIAMMPQFTSIYFSYTVYDTVLLGRYAHSGNSLGEMLGRISSHDKEIVDKAIETTGLSNIKNQQLSSLSGGQLQRVMLARTIVQETPIILLDEPTNHLDLKHHIELISYLKDWVKQKTTIGGTTYPNTVISVFHDIGTASILAENIILINDGQIIKKGPAEEVLTRDILKDIYDVDVLSYYDEIYKNLLK
jgi:ABC-type cobalamin/Fe3+-siderophores transport systems, ATPase components